MRFKKMKNSKFKIQNSKFPACTNVLAGRHAPRRGGFTLIEIVLYLALFAVVVGSISGLLYTILQSRVKNQVIAEVEQQGMQTIALITQTARNATTLTSPTIGTTTATLSLAVPTASLSPTVFSLASASIVITEGAGGAITLTNSRVVVSALSFQNLSRAGTKGTVRIQFTLAHVNPASKNEYDYTKTFIASATLR
jgi:Tfp pilus assembly protein PilW